MPVPGLTAGPGDPTSELGAGDHLISCCCYPRTTRLQLMDSHLRGPPTWPFLVSNTVSCVHSKHVFRTILVNHLFCHLKLSIAFFGTLEI